MNILSKRVRSLIQNTFTALMLPFRKLYLYFFISRVQGKLHSKERNNPVLDINNSDDLKILKNKIKGNYCLLGLPEHVNIGDHLITMGTKDFLEILPCSCTYVSSDNNFKSVNIGAETTILLQGGGNFGDIWQRPQLFKEQIVKQFPDNQIIILPQTIYYIDKDKLEKTVDIYSQHKNLTICARDHRSYKTAQKHFKKNTVLLIPDMASFTKLTVEKNRKKKTGKILYIDRDDKELKEKMDLLFLSNLIKNDWPTFNNFFYRSLRNKHMKYKLFVNEGIYFLSDFDLVISTRMHGSILANLLDIPTILIDNSYGKCKTLYETWHKETPGFYLAENQEDVMSIIKHKFSNTIKSEGAVSR